jgi:hypothetical protein
MRKLKTRDERRTRGDFDVNEAKNEAKSKVNSVEISAAITPQITKGKIKSEFGSTIFEKASAAPLRTLYVASRMAKQRKAFEVFAALKADTNFSLSLIPADAITVATPELTPGKRETSIPANEPEKVALKEGSFANFSCLGISAFLAMLTMSVGEAKSPVRRGKNTEEARFSCASTAYLSDT